MANTTTRALVELLANILDEAADGISQAPKEGEDETYCYGNLIHIRRSAEAAMRLLGS